MRTTKRTLTALIVALGVAGLAGCAKEGVKAKEPQQTARVAPSRVQGEYVPAGTEFTISLNQTLGTALSREGQEFTAAVREPLRAPDGTVVVPAGALIRGKVKHIDSGATPVLALDFNSVQTSYGKSDIKAKIRGAERVNFPGKNEVYQPEKVGKYDAFFVAPPGPAAAGTAYGFYEGFQFYNENTREIRVPAGADLRMVLTKPLVPPGSKIKD